jgi:hypothetical protein
MNELTKYLRESILGQGFDGSNIRGVRAQGKNLVIGLTKWSDAINEKCTFSATDFLKNPEKKFDVNSFRKKVMPDKVYSESELRASASESRNNIDWDIVNLDTLLSDEDKEYIKDHAAKWFRTQLNPAGVFFADKYGIEVQLNTKADGKLYIEFNIGWYIRFRIVIHTAAMQYIKYDIK